jgi:hypothetical protein
VPTVATPVFGPSGGTFSREVDIHIFCSTSGATIYYTTNGSTPTTSSTVYAGGQIVLTGKGTKTVKAFATKAGFAESAVATAIYTIN